MQTVVHLLPTSSNMAAITERLATCRGPSGSPTSISQGIAVWWTKRLQWRKPILGIWSMFRLGVSNVFHLYPLLWLELQIIVFSQHVASGIAYALQKIILNRDLCISGQKCIYKTLGTLRESVLTLRCQSLSRPNSLQKSNIGRLGPSKIPFLEICPHSSTNCIVRGLLHVESIGFGMIPCLETKRLNLMTFWCLIMNHISCSRNFRWICISHCSPSPAPATLTILPTRMSNFENSGWFGSSFRS